MTIADRLSSRPALQRRVLATALIPVALGAAWLLIAVPVRWVAVSQDTWRAEMRLALARTRGQAEAEPILRRQRAQLPSAPVWRYFYRREEGVDAATAIQRDVAASCAEAGLASESLVALPSQEERGLTKYTVRLTGTGNAEQLRTFVMQLRQRTRYLRVERLSIKAPQSQAADQNATLTATLDIAGYAAASPAAAGRST